jgi:hypothetical protein
MRMRTVNTPASSTSDLALEIKKDGSFLPKNILPGILEVVFEVGEPRWCSQGKMSPRED